MKGLRYQYSNSLLSIANESNNSQLIYDEIQSLISSEFVSKYYLNYLGSPVVSYKDKESELNRVFKGKVEELLLKFILVVIRAKRALFLREIFETYIVVFEDLHMIKTVDIATTTNISDSTMLLIKKSIESKLQGYKIKYNLFVDKSLLGGYVISWDGKQLDCSVKGALSKLSRGMA